MRQLWHPARGFATGPIFGRGAFVMPSLHLSQVDRGWGIRRLFEAEDFT
jgi:hypothetical protein